MKRTDMVNEIEYTISNGIDDERTPLIIALKVLRVVERYGMEPPVVWRQGASDGPGEGQLVNEWED